MEFKKTQNVVLPDVDFTEEDIQSLKLVNPVDFVSKEDHEHIMEVLKQGLRDMKNPDKWMTWEDLNESFKEYVKNATV